MSIPHRGKTGFNTYFITFNTWEKKRLLQSHRSASLLIELLYKFRAEKCYLVHEFVVMPNHFHALLTPLAPNTLERGVGFIKGAFTFQYRRVAMFRGEVWQPSFVDRRVRGAEDYAAFRLYIHNNPVKARLASTPQEYAYGSASGKYELDEVPQALKTISLAASMQG